MRNRFAVPSLILVANLFFAPLQFAQSPKPTEAAKSQLNPSAPGSLRANGKANLSGVWAESQPPSAADQYWVFALSPNEPPMSRHIYTDGRRHNTDLSATWMGDSIGKWEGDTLVADTTNFNDKTWLDRIGHPHSADLHLIERFRRVSPEKLQIELTIEDSKAYTKPWNATLYYSLQKGWSLLEQYCEDNDTFQDVEKQETNKPAK
jgi:hypothetical protein